MCVLSHVGLPQLKQVDICNTERFFFLIDTGLFPVDKVGYILQVCFPQLTPVHVYYRWGFLSGQK